MASVLRRTARLARLALLALGAAVVSGPAAAEICGLKVYDSVNAERIGEADSVFRQGDEFIVCFTPLKDGYVSLWDRIPADAPVERLGPSQVFEKNHKARKVAAGETQCFGDGSAEPGSTRYKLVMEAKDGLGLGRMWLVYSEALDAHPDQAAFDSVFMFKDSYERRFGAGAIDAGPEDGGARPDPTGCTAAGSLEFDYRVVAKQ